MRTRQRQGILGAIVIAVLLALLCSGLSVSRHARNLQSITQTEPVRSTTPAKTDAQTKALVDRQDELEQLKHKICDGMAEVAKDDTYAEGLTSKFCTGTCVMTLTPEGATMGVYTGVASTDEVCTGTPLVLVGEPELKKLITSSHPTGFSYADHEFMFVITKPWTTWYLGAVALKQAVHWDLDMSGQEVNAPTFSAPWLDSELKAYDLEFAAIDRYTHGGFSQAIDDLIEREHLTVPQLADAQGQLTDKDQQWLLDHAFVGDALSSEEAAHRRGSAIMAYHLTLAGRDRENRRNTLRWLYGQQSS